MYKLIFVLFAGDNYEQFPFALHSSVFLSNCSDKYLNVFQFHLKHYYQLQILAKTRDTCAGFSSFEALAGTNIVTRACRYNK